MAVTAGLHRGGTRGRRYEPAEYAAITSSARSQFLVSSLLNIRTGIPYPPAGPRCGTSTDPEPSQLGGLVRPRPTATGWSQWKGTYTKSPASRGFSGIAVQGALTLGIDDLFSRQAAGAATEERSPGSSGWTRRSPTPSDFPSAHPCNGPIGLRRAPPPAQPRDAGVGAAVPDGLCGCRLALGPEPRAPGLPCLRAPAHRAPV